MDAEQLSHLVAYYQGEIARVSNLLYIAKDKKSHYKELLQGNEVISEPFARLFAQLSLHYLGKTTLRRGKVIIRFANVTYGDKSYVFKVSISDITVDVGICYNMKVLFAHSQIAIDDLGFGANGKSFTDLLDIISQITRLHDYLVATTTPQLIESWVGQLRRHNKCYKEIPTCICDLGDLQFEITA